MQGAVQTTFSDTTAVDFALKHLGTETMPGYPASVACRLQAAIIKCGLSLGKYGICNKNLPDLGSHSSKALLKILHLCKEETKDRRKE